MGSLQFPNMGMGLRLAAFGRRSSANMGMGLRLAAFGRRSSAINAGVILISNLMFSWNNVESFNLAKNKGAIASTYLTWSAVRCSVPK